MLKKFYYFLFLPLPKNHLSALVGWFVHLPLPSSWSRFLIRSFIRLFEVKLEEVEKGIDAYCSLGEFFIRNLKSGIRPLEEGVVSPVDGTIVEYGALADDQLLQVKGKSYSVFSLIGEEEVGKSFLNGFFITIYLAPADYHHVHSPVNGRILLTYYIPGSLWPVNFWALNQVDNLFSRNERFFTLIESDEMGYVGVVSIGATNVGAIRLTYDTLQANQGLTWFSKRSNLQILRRRYTSPPSICKGEKIATFCMGSTVVLLFQTNCFHPSQQCRQGPIKLGQSLGQDKCSYTKLH